MVDSRLSTNPSSIFHCFAEVHAKPASEADSQLTQLYPAGFEDKDGLLKQIPQFCFPCNITNNGVQYSTFVLTDLESKFRFGFCRYPPKAVHCLCLVSYLPWFETFYTILDKLSLLSEEDVTRFLALLNQQSRPDPGGTLSMSLNIFGKDQAYNIKIPDTRKLPSIPENRNLTEYFAKVQPHNMIHLFVSMLFERRIIVTSEKLSVLTAVIHGSVSLLYPMQWQHIYVPILPPNLIDYCCAPMPFLLGVHSSLMPKVRQMPMNEVVILNADTNELEFSEDDLDKFPSKMAARLRKNLSRTEKALHRYVSTQFLKALADLIGGYREAFKFTDTDKGGKISFDDEMFLATRTGSMKLFLEQILELQSFRQFIAGRLDMVNDGVEFIDIFEQAVIKRNADVESDTSQWREKMKKGGGAFKKTVGGKYDHLKGIVNEIEVKDVKNKLKSKANKGYKGLMKLKDGMKKEDKTDSVDSLDATVKRNNSLPASRNKKSVIKKERHSLYLTSTRHAVMKPAATPPPRPPQPTRKDSKETSSVEMVRKDVLKVETHCPESYSEPNIAALIDMSDSSDDDDSMGSSEDFFKSNSSLGGSSKNSEHDGSFHNPAFAEPQNNSEVSSVSSEDILDPAKQFARRSSQLKRSNPVRPTRPTIPPRPQAIAGPSSSSPNKPTRPPPPRPSPPVVEKNNREKQTIYDSDESLAEPNLLDQPARQEASSFYKPSADLLDLDCSLFHETMASLSDDTRSFITPPGSSRSSTKSSNSGVSPIAGVTPPHEPEILTPSGTFADNFSVQPKSTADDLLADCLRTAKKDLEIKMKRETLSTELNLLTNHVTQPSNQNRERDPTNNGDYYYEI